MNPKVVNTSNVVAFGFSTEFRLEERQIVFSIDGITEFKTGGANAVLGISFEVIDPSGVHLSDIQFPNVQIDPSTQNSYTVPLPGSFSEFGFYQIRGILRENDSLQHEVIIPPKNVCKPIGFEKDLVKGRFDIKPDCDQATLTIDEVTNFVYAGHQFLYATKSGMLYYPRGTHADVPFIFTPFQMSGTAQLFTGTYTVRNKTKATFDMGDLVSITITYATNQEQKVTCKKNLCKVICCIEDMYSEYTRDCNSKKGQAAKKKLEAISIPLTLAIIKEKCGQDAHEQVALIEKELGCDCKCGDNEQVEPSLVNIGGGQTVNINGACATEVTSTVSGNTRSYTIKTKSDNVLKLDPTDLGFGITKTWDNCNWNYNISLNYPALSLNILNTIKNSTELSLLLNSIIKTTTGVDILGLDGRCIIETGSCDYTLTDKITASVAVVSIFIGGNLYPGPSGMLLQDAVGVQDWLNSLNMGVWTVSYTNDTGDLIIKSLNNTNTIGTLQLRITSSSTTYSKAFIKECKTLKKILQAIIDYLCSLNTAQVKLQSRKMLCRIATDGSIEQVEFLAGSTLEAYLEAQGAAICKLFNSLMTPLGINCAKIKELFPTTTKKLTEKDFILGTKEEQG